MDNRIRKHWIIYYHERKSLVSDNMLMDEVRRMPIPPSVVRTALLRMLTFARANAKPNETHFAIGRAIEPEARRSQKTITDILPCR